MDTDESTKNVPSADFDAEVQKLVDESPKLDSACKNLIALLSAKSLPTEEPVPTTELLSCARVLLKKLNAHIFVDVVEWGTKHPQGEQTALARINQLREYKVVSALRARVGQMSGKPSKLFGKSFILWSGCWKEVREECEANQPLDVPDNVYTLFLDSFELSLGLHESEQSGRLDITTSEIQQQRQQKQEEHGEAVNTVLKACIDSDTDRGSSSLHRAHLRPALKASVEDKDLIWASSFTTALAARRTAREAKMSAQIAWVNHAHVDDEFVE